MSKIAWIGLGVMGFPMAGHLKTRGRHDVVVFNRTPAKADAWVKTFGGRSAATPAEAAAGAEFVFTCVGNDDDLRQVTLGSAGTFAALAPGAIAIDHTTASAEIARELHAAAKARGANALDATPGEAAAGAEFVFTCVGNDDDLRQVTLGPARNVRRACARRHRHRPHHGLGRNRARAPRRRQGAWRERARCAGVRRSIRRRERNAHRHGGRGRRGLWPGRARARRLRADLQSDRTPGLRPAHQDGQPDLHRRLDRGARRGAPLRAAVPVSISRR